MTVQHFHTTARFSEMTIHQNTVYLAGQLAEDLDADITGQTQQTLDIIDHLLAEANSDKSLILSATIYLKDIQQDYAAMNQVWDAWLKHVKAPPRTCVEARLYQENVRVEITIIAAVRAVDHVTD